MKLIAGLGNPGKEYEKTRHNSGFLAVDKLAEKLGTSITSEKWNALVASVRINGEQVTLMKPLTYMNESGSAISQAVKFYKLQPEDILILHDDMDIPVGVRIGVGHSEPGNHAKVPDWVLSPVPKAEREDFERIISIAADAAAAWVNEPLDKVMNKFNIKEKKK